jgi:hypothetical protein
MGVVQYAVGVLVLLASLLSCRSAPEPGRAASTQDVIIRSLVGELDMGFDMVADEDRIEVVLTLHVPDGATGRNDRGLRAVAG